MHWFKWIVSTLTLIAITTAVALEGGDVVRVQTVNAETEQPRYTRIWFVQSGKQLVLEAGSPEHPWVLDVQQQDTIRLIGQGLDGEYRARMLSANSHAEIRQMMRRKYGWRDVWVALLFDTSRSRMVLAESLATV